jgi:hypothetical protein
MSDLDEVLRAAGAHWRAQQRDPVVNVVSATARSRSRRGLVAAIVCVIVVVPTVAVVAFRANPRRRVHVAPTSAPTRSAVIVLNSEIAQPDVLAVDGNRLWVTGYAPGNGGNPGPAHLQELDAGTGKVLGDLTLPDNAPLELQVGDGAVWVSAQQGETSTELLKIDIATMRIVSRIPNTKDGQLAVTPNAVWATDGVGGLRRIDPTSGRVVATIKLHGNSLYPPIWVTAGPVGVFVGNGYTGTIQRIDETTNTAGPEIHVAPDSAEMVELHGSLWVERSDGTQLIEVVNGVNPRPPIDLGERAQDLTSDGTSLWLGTGSGHVLRVDPQSRSVSRVALPRGTQDSTAAADPTTGAVWAASDQPTPRLIRVHNPAVTAPSRDRHLSVVVPNVLGSRSPARAGDEVVSVGLKVHFIQVPSTAPVGWVIAQHPRGGVQIASGSMVTLSLSSGP